jgi:HlyD family secretion protein
MAEIAIHSGPSVKPPVKGKARRRRILLIIALLLIVGIGLTLYKVLANQTPSTSGMQLVTVRRGDVTETVSASGTVQAQNQVSLNFTSSGERLTALNVKIGDHVKAGQVLAAIDDSAAVAQVNTQVANLAAAQAKLAQAQQGPTAQDIAVQQANVNKAKVALDGANNSFDSQKAYAQLQKAKSQVSNVQSTFNTDKALYSTGAIAKNEMDQAKSNLDQAQADYSAAEVQYNQAQSQTSNAVAQAQASYNAAVAQLHQTQAPSNAGAVEEAKAGVQQAQTQLQAQQNDLSKYTLRAPMDGVIVQVNGNAGEIPANNQPVIVMDNSMNNLEVTAQVSQSDIGKIKEGASAVVTTSAYQGKEFRSRVIKIYPEATTQSGVTTYTVQLSVDNSEGDLKPGMTGNVTIQVGTHKNVLIVPSAALKVVNGKDGVYTIAGSNSGAASDSSQTKQRRNGTKKAGNGNLQFQPVTVGYFSFNQVEIVSGLKEGEKVVETFNSSSNSSTSSSANKRGTNGIGGIGGIGGMGGIPGLRSGRGGN